MTNSITRSWRLTTALIGSVAALCLAPCAFAADGASTISDAEWASMKDAARSRVRHIIYENDGDDCLVYPEAREASVEGYLAQRTSYLNKYPVDTVFYTPTEAGFGHVSLDIEHADQIMVQPKTFNPAEKRKNIYPYLKSIGTDTLTEQIKYCRANGIEIFCDVRTNDIHDAQDRPNKPHLLFSAFKRNHPEYLFATWDKPTQFGAWSSLDYDAAGVREYFLAHVKDIAFKYPVDGISFDFHRWPRLFRTVGRGAVATDEQRALITGLFREVRRFTEQAGRAHGRPQLIAIRVPDSVGFCRDMGLDLEALLSEGLVDIVLSGGNFRLNPWSYSKELCDKYGVKMYPSIDMPQFSPEGNYRIARGAPMSYYGRIAAAFQSGVEGCYYFNLFSEHACKNVMRASMEDIRLENKRYHLTDRWLERPTGSLKTAPQYMNMPTLHPSAPKHLNPGEPQTFPLEFGDDIAALTAEGNSVKVQGIIKSNSLRDNAIKVTSNGQEWIFQSYDDQFLYYSIPAGALLPGLNQLTVEATAVGNGKAVGMVTVMSGKELLAGEKQAPWRRLWERTETGKSESIVNGAYCLKDFGKGMTNFYYPLAGWDRNIVLEFGFKLGDSSDDRGVGVRIANGKHYEALLFSKEGLSLEIAGKSVAFDTTGAFHTYRIRLSGEKFFVEADGKQLFSTPLTATVDDSRAAYTGSTYAEGDMHEKGIVIGSLSDEGTSVSYWKNVKLRMPAGGASLQDLAVEVIIARPVTTSEVGTWDYSAGEGAGVLPCGNHSYSRDLIAGEIDFSSMPANGTRIIFSNGGSSIGGTIANGLLTMNDGVTVALPENGPFTLRGEDNEGQSLVAVVGAAGTSVSESNVSGQIQNNEFAGLGKEALAAIRNSGIVVQPADHVTALRGTWVKPVVAVPAFTPVAAYDAADGLPAFPWGSRYARERISMNEDGLLLLDNEHPSKRWQDVVLKDGEVLKSLGKKAVFSSRFTMAKAATAPEKEFYTMVLARIDADGEHEVIIRIAKDYIETNFGKVSADFDTERSHEVAVELEFASNHARLWLDGALLVDGAATPNSARTDECLMFGDGAVSCGGAVIVENFQIGPAEE